MAKEGGAINKLLSIGGVLEMILKSEKLRYFKNEKRTFREKSGKRKARWQTRRPLKHSWPKTSAKQRHGQ